MLLFQAYVFPLIVYRQAALGESVFISNESVFIRNYKVYDARAPYEPLINTHPPIRRTPAVQSYEPGPIASEFCCRTPCQRPAERWELAGKTNARSLKSIFFFPLFQRTSGCFQERTAGPPGPVVPPALCWAALGLENLTCLFWVNEIKNLSKCTTNTI